MGPGGPGPAMGAAMGYGMMGGGGGMMGHGDFMATKKIFVGGLAHETTEQDFSNYFGAPTPDRAAPPTPPTANHHTARAQASTAW